MELETCKRIKVAVEKQIAEDLKYCIEEVHKGDKVKGKKQHKDWFPPHSKGEAAYYALCELIGYMEDKVHDETVDTINGEPVMPIKDTLWCLKMSLVQRLSGSIDAEVDTDKI